MIIAIDGPAASGKGTLARHLATHYGLPHLDTGLLYRATARALIDEGRRRIIRQREIQCAELREQVDGGAAATRARGRERPPRP